MLHPHETQKQVMDSAVQHRLVAHGRRWGGDTLVGLVLNHLILRNKSARVFYPTFHLMSYARNHVLKQIAPQALHTRRIAMHVLDFTGTIGQQLSGADMNIFMFPTQSHWGRIGQQVYLDIANGYKGRVLIVGTPLPVYDKYDPFVQMFDLFNRIDNAQTFTFATDQNPFIAPESLRIFRESFGPVQTDIRARNAESSQFYGRFIRCTDQAA